MDAAKVAAASADELLRMQSDKERVERQEREVRSRLDERLRLMHEEAMRCVRIQSRAPTHRLCACAAVPYCVLAPCCVCVSLSAVQVERHAAGACVRLPPSPEPRLRAVV